jgi:hypothetical protein
MHKDLDLILSWSMPTWREARLLSRPQMKIPFAWIKLITSPSTAPAHGDRVGIDRGTMEGGGGGGGGGR